jgi:zinc protease
MKTSIKILAAGMVLASLLPAKAQQVVELKQPLSSKVVLKFMFRNGSISDPAGKEGLTWLTTQTLTETGTKDLTYAQIQEKIYPMAAYYYGSTDKEVSVFTFAVPRDYLDQFYPIVKGLLLTPSFTKEDFERVKSNQQNYVDQVIRASSDEEYSKKALEDLLFRGTRYQHMAQGKSASVKALTQQDVKDHYRQHFTRNNLTIGIAGNYTADFLKKLQADAAQLPASGAQKPAEVKPKMPDGLQVEIISKETALGSAVFAGFPMPLTRADNDFAALMVANSYLGEHRQSEGLLFQKIRSARSMNYGDYTYLEWFNNGGGNFTPPAGTPRKANYFGIWLRPVQTAEGLKKQYPELKDIQTGHAQFALRLTLREIDNLVKNGMPKEEFDLIRAYLRSYTKLYVQTPEQQLGYLLDSRFYGRQDYIKELDALLGKLTLEDVNAAMRKYWQTKNLYVTIITDDSEAGPLAEALRNNTPSPMSYSNAVKEGLPKEVQTEDEAVATYPLNVKSVKIVKSEATFL